MPLDLKVGLCPSCSPRLFSSHFPSLLPNTQLKSSCLQILPLGKSSCLSLPRTSRTPGYCTIYWSLIPLFSLPPLVLSSAFSQPPTLWLYTWLLPITAPTLHNPKCFYLMTPSWLPSTSQFIFWNFPQIQESWDSTRTSVHSSSELSSVPHATRALTSPFTWLRSYSPPLQSHTCIFPQVLFFFSLC